MNQNVHRLEEEVRMLKWMSGVNRKNNIRFAIMRSDINKQANMV